jgi:hypothetical protein
MENVVENASMLRGVLASKGGLNLWEVGAILKEPRSGALQVLAWMASRRQIVYSIEDQQLLVTLAQNAEGAAALEG